MKDEKDYCYTCFLFEEDYLTILGAFLKAIQYWNNSRNGTLDWDAHCQWEIDRLERALNNFTGTNLKELPTPPEKI